MIELQDVCKDYGVHSILRHINARFAPNALHLLCGKNGSGKTTLLKIIANLVKPSAGTVSLQGDPRIIYVAHQTFLYPNLTALENLAFWTSCYRLTLPEEELLTWLDTFGLLAFSDQYPRFFSRGMAQKLNLARALMLKPDILLLDEPATGLDADAQNLLRGLLQKQKEKGTCILLISHSLHDDSPIADSLSIIEHGSLRKEVLSTK